MLSDNTSITIKPADKGGNIVLMDNATYTSMCSKILMNKNWYSKIIRDIMDRFNQEYYSLIDSTYANKVINKTIWEYIITKFPVVLTFYSLPKIHKDRLNPTGRPIISGMESIGENASRLIDEYLKPHVISLRSFVKEIPFTSSRSFKILWYLIMPIWLPLMWKPSIAPSPTPRDWQLLNMQFIKEGI